MTDRISDTIAHLEALVGFKTLSAQSNRDFIDYVRTVLARYNIASHLSTDQSGKRANLHALIGPEVDGGVVLNGHSDVVPVGDQPWSSDAFQLTRRGARLFGRGAVDMKGFLACMLGAVPLWQAKPLQKPIHFTIAFDEENGGFGAPILVADICRHGPRPQIAIIGEPTQMQIVSAHKGGLEMSTRVTGQAAHSADPGRGVNAIDYATRFIAHLNSVADGLARNECCDERFDPGYSTLNVGAIRGGLARNIVAPHCQIDWELRPLPATDAQMLIDEIDAFAQNGLLRDMRKAFSAAAITTTMHANVPALAHEQAACAIAKIAPLLDSALPQAVSFGTDAGHFAAAGISTIVMGPGSIAQAHQPDEFIEITQIADCLAFFDRLGDGLSR